MRAGVPVFAPELAEGKGSDADYTWDALVAAEERHFWFRSRLRLILWALRRYFPHARNVLDLGCGTGHALEAMSRLLPGVTTSGSDARLEGLAHAGRRLPRTQLLQMDAGHIPFRDEFDVIGAFDVIEHLDEDEAALAEMFRAVRPGGGILLTVPQHRFLWSAADDYSCHRRRYSRSELFAKVRSAGFEVLRSTSFTAVLLPLLVAARRGRRRPLSEFDPTAELRVGRATNLVLDAALRLEGAFIRGGVSFPAGGSLLLAAKRPS
jgi:SAM-dependent methyltransferase